MEVTLYDINRMLNDLGMTPVDDLGSIQVVKA